METKLFGEFKINLASREGKKDVNIYTMLRRTILHPSWHSPYPHNKEVTGSTHKNVVSRSFVVYICCNGGCRFV